MSLALSAAVTFTSIFAGTGITASAAKGITGDGTQDDPYVIMNYSGLKEYSDIVNSAGEGRFYAKLGADITGSASDPFTSVGSNEEYRIHFDGNGKTIRNVKVKQNSDTSYAGFFGYLATLEISNVTFENCSISAPNAPATAMVVGGLYSSHGEVKDFQKVTVKNCSVSGGSYVGGLIGSMGAEYTGKGDLYYCVVQDSMISGTGNNIGGIAGDNLYQLTGCQVLNSTVQGTGTASKNIGGIVGNNKNAKMSISETERENTIQGCTFSGQVSGTENVGGIAGTTVTDIIQCKVIQSTDKDLPSKISGTTNVGGVVGSTYTKKVSSSVNNAEVSGGTNVGGVAGVIGGCGTISNSDNRGAVKGTSNVGGVCGEGRTSAKVDKSSNAGKIEGKKNVAGIAGLINDAQGALTDNTNKATGSVTGETNVGGIAGLGQGMTMSGNKNLAEINGQDKVGGLVGRLEATGSIGNNATNNINEGNVNGTKSVGGLVGENESTYRAASTIDDNQNYGKVTGKEVVAGLVGKNIGSSQDRNSNSTVKNCTNAGDVYGDETVAGCIGTNSGKSENNKNTGTVFVKSTTNNASGTIAKGEDYNPNRPDQTIKGTDTGSTSTTEPIISDVSVGDVLIDKDTPVDPDNDLVPPYGKGENTVKVTAGNLSVVVVPAGAGTVSVTSIAKDQTGLLATAESGYSFSGWVVDGKYVSTQTQALFDTSKEITVCAVFYQTGKKDPKTDIENYDPNATPAPGESASPAPGESASPAPGESASPAPGQSASPAPGESASPAPGQSASPAPGGATPLPNTTPAAGTTIINETTVINHYDTVIAGVPTGSAIASVKAYGVTVSVVPAGSGSITLTALDTAKATMGLTATPAAGYTFSRWIVDGRDAGTTAASSFAIREGSYITAVFEKSTTVTAASGSVVTGTVVKDGTYIYVITNPAKHYCKVIGVVASKKKTIKSIKVPNAIRKSGVKYRVTAIEKNAFKGLKKVTKATINTNVKTIGIKAFYNCKKLKKVTIRTKKLTKIGKFAFKNIHKKATIKVPKKKFKKYKKMLKKSKVSKKTKIR